MIRLLLVAVLVLAFSAGAAQARGGDHGGGGGGDEVRVAGRCGQGVAASLRLRAGDRRIEVRFRLRQSHVRGAWRVAIVHEHRVSVRATRRTTRMEHSFELRRMLPDLQGSDTVVVHAWGPRGAGCDAAGTLPG